MRIPEELKEALDKAAFENKRSLTAEVVDRLEQSFVMRAEPDAAAGTAQVIDRLEALEQQLAAKTREDTLLRLKHIRQSLALSEQVQREGVARDKERVQRIESEVAAAESRQDLGAFRHLQAKLREARKTLRETEISLENIRVELRDTDAHIEAFAQSAGL
jgi:Arc-like DNA binding domain.